MRTFVCLLGLLWIAGQLGAQGQFKIGLDSSGSWSCQSRLDTHVGGLDTTAFLHLQGNAARDAPSLLLNGDWLAASLSGGSFGLEAGNFALGVVRWQGSGAFMRRGLDALGELSLASGPLLRPGLGLNPSGSLNRLGLSLEGPGPIVQLVQENDGRRRWLNAALGWRWDGTGQGMRILAAQRVLASEEPSLDSWEASSSAGAPRQAALAFDGAWVLDDCRLAAATSVLWDHAAHARGALAASAFWSSGPLEFDLVVAGTSPDFTGLEDKKSAGGLAARGKAALALAPGLRARLQGEIKGDWLTDQKLAVPGDWQLAGGGGMELDSRGVSGRLSLGVEGDEWSGSLALGLEDKIVAWRLRAKARGVLAGDFGTLDLGSAISLACDPGSIALDFAAAWRPEDQRQARWSWDMAVRTCWIVSTGLDCSIDLLWEDLSANAPAVAWLPRLELALVLE